MVHHQSIKELILLLWQKRVTIHLVASDHKFNIMNINLSPYLPFAYFFTRLFSTCSSLEPVVHNIVLCSSLYFCFCLLAIHVRFLAFSVLPCNTGFAVISFLFLFHLQILYLTIVSSHFAFLFQIF